jgi:hypothetical protein
MITLQIVDAVDEMVIAAAARNSASWSDEQFKSVVDNIKKEKQDRVRVSSSRPR